MLFIIRNQTFEIYSLAYIKFLPFRILIRNTSRPHSALFLSFRKNKKNENNSTEPSLFQIIHQDFQKCFQNNFKHFKHIYKEVLKSSVKPMSFFFVFFVFFLRVTWLLFSTSVIPKFKVFFCFLINITTLLEKYLFEFLVQFSSGFPKMLPVYCLLGGKVERDG